MGAERRRGGKKRAQAQTQKRDVYDAGSENESEDELSSKFFNRGPDAEVDEEIDEDAAFVSGDEEKYSMFASKKYSSDEEEFAGDKDISDLLEDESSLSQAVHALSSRDRLAQMAKEQRSQPVLSHSLTSMASTEEISLSDLYNPAELSNLDLASKKLDKLVHESSALAVAEPLPEVESKREHREESFAAASKDVSKWQSIVEANRTAESIDLTNREPTDIRFLGTQFITKFKPSTSLEKDLNSLTQIYQQSTPTAKPAASRTSVGNSAESRSLTFLENIKNRHLKKIKSKGYHKRRKKQGAEVEEEDYERERAVARFENSLKTSARFNKKFSKVPNRGGADTPEFVKEEARAKNALRQRLEKRPISEDESEEEEIREEVDPRTPSGVPTPQLPLPDISVVPQQPQHQLQARSGASRPSLPLSNSLQSVHTGLSSGKMFQSDAALVVEQGSALVGEVYEADAGCTENPWIAVGVMRGKEKNKNVGTIDNSKILELESTKAFQLVEKEQSEQNTFVQMAFGNDDEEVEQFMLEDGEEDDQKSGAQEMPAWGVWGGEGVKKRKRVQAEPTPKKKAEKVVINPKRNKAATKYQVTKVPYPFQTREQYERSLDLPLGTEWNAMNVHSKLVRPRIVLHAGDSIAPIEWKASSKGSEAQDGPSRLA